MVMKLFSPSWIEVSEVKGNVSILFMTSKRKNIHIRTTDGIINTKALGKFAPVVIGLLSGFGEVER